MAPGYSQVSESSGYRPSRTVDAHQLWKMSVVVKQGGWDLLANNFSIVKAKVFDGSTLYTEILVSARLPPPPIPYLGTCQHRLWHHRAPETRF